MFSFLLGRTRKGYVSIPLTDREEMKMGLLGGKMKEDSERDHRATDASRSRVRTSWRSKLVLTIYTILTAANLAVLGTLFATKQLRWPGVTPRNWHQRMVNAHSPVYDLMDIELRDIQWEGNLFNNATSSIFRQAPSPEVDRAWAEISDIKTFLVDRVDIERVGKDPNIAVRVPESWGVGEKYIAQLDGPHQLHCLDVVRKQLYSEYYYGPGGDSHPLYWAHITHCLDIVRQALMCSSSVDLITFNFDPTQPGPNYDFNQNHMCRDHYALLAWVDEHEVDWEKNGWLVEPEGYPTQPVEEAYLAAVPALLAYNKAHGIPNPDPKVAPPVPPGTNHHKGGHHQPAYGESHHR